MAQLQNRLTGSAVGWVRSRTTAWWTEAARDRSRLLRMDRDDNPHFRVRELGLDAGRSRPIPGAQPVANTHNRCFRSFLSDFAVRVVDLSGLGEVLISTPKNSKSAGPLGRGFRYRYKQNSISPKMLPQPANWPSDDKLNETKRIQRGSKKSTLCAGTSTDNAGERVRVERAFFALRASV